MDEGGNAGRGMRMVPALNSRIAFCEDSGYVADCLGVLGAVPPFKRGAVVRVRKTL